MNNKSHLGRGHWHVPEVQLRPTSAKHSTLLRHISLLFFFDLQIFSLTDQKLAKNIYSSYNRFEWINELTLIFTCKPGFCTDKRPRYKRVLCCQSTHRPWYKWLIPWIWPCIPSGSCQQSSRGSDTHGPACWSTWACRSLPSSQVSLSGRAFGQSVTSDRTENNLTDFKRIN